MELKLSGQVAMITGAGAGIGFTTAKAFLDEGVSVIAADLDISGLSELAATGKLLPVLADMSEPDAAAAVVKQGLDAFGRIDILFNNAAAIQPRGSFLNVSDEDWKRTFQLNVMGYIRATRAVLPTMLEAGHGSIIHNASESARMGSPVAADYCLSKASVLMLSKILSQEFTSRGVRSNVVSPAQIRTPMLEKPGGMIDVVANHLGVDRNEAVTLWLKEMHSPTGRLGLPEEVASVVLFLASSQSSFITGVEVPVDGGVRPFV